MINCIFLLTTNGELIAYKELTPTKSATCKPLQLGLVYKQKGETLPTIIKEGGIFYVFSEQDQVVVVATCEDGETSAFLVLESLHKLCAVFQDFFGVLKPQTLRSNVALMYEIIDESFSLGMPREIETSKLKPILCNLASNKRTKFDSSGWNSSLANSIIFKTEKTKQRDIAPSDVSQKPVYSTAGKAEVKEQLFVDLFEQLVVLIDSIGSIILCEIKGNLHIKSSLDKQAKVRINFSDQSSEFLNIANLHPKVKRNEKSVTQLETAVNPGSLCAFSYFSSHYNKSVPFPFTLYSLIKPHKDNKTITIELKIHCALSEPLSALKFKGILPLPSNIICCSGKSSLFSMNFSTEKEGFVFSCPVFPCDSHHSVLMQLNVSEITPATSLELSSVVFQFEVPNFSPSNLRINSLHVQKERYEGLQESNYEKWTRHLMYSNSYRFLLDTTKSFSHV